MAYVVNMASVVKKTLWIALSTGAVLALLSVFTILTSPDFHRERRSAESTQHVLTLNTALNGVEIKKMERRDKLISLLQQTGIESDFLCLQEVDFITDVKRITEDLKATYPYSFSGSHIEGVVSHRNAGAGQCVGTEFENYRDCVEMNCTVGASTTQELIERALCILAKCKDLLESIPDQTCLSCLATFSGTPQTFSRCSQNDPDVEINPSGLLVLSKYELTNPALVVFPPEDTRRTIYRPGYIRASLSELGTVVCAHQIQDIGPIYFEENMPEYSSFAEENKGQTQHILDTFTGTGAPLVLLGDLNTGPLNAAQAIIANLPESYALYTGASSSLSTILLNQCTLCGTSNTLKSLLSAEVDVTVDHVFVQGHTLISVQRILDANDAVPTPDLLPNTPAIAVSDHYGVRAKISIAQPDERSVLRKKLLNILNKYI